MCQLLAIIIFIPNDKPAVKHHLENFRQCGLFRKGHRDVGTSQRESQDPTSKKACRFRHKSVRSNIPAHQIPSSPTTNLHIIFGLFQGSMQENSSCLRNYRTSSHAASKGDRNFSALLNIIVVQHLDPGRYQKVLDGYNTGSLYWFSKYLDALDTELALIDHLRRLTNTLPVISRESTRSVSKRRLQTQMNFTRQKQEPSISFSHKRFRELIKMQSIGWS